MGGRGRGVDSGRLEHLLQSALEFYIMHPSPLECTSCRPTNPPALLSPPITKAPAIGIIGAGGGGSHAHKKILI